MKLQTALPSIFRRFVKDSDGVTAIEFSILLLPFCALLFAVLESCISFGAQQVMANAMDDLARSVRTGQLINPSEDQVKTEICDKLKIIVASDCKDIIKVDLKAYGTYAAAATAAKLTFSANGVDTSGFTVAAGGAQTINMIRVVYMWPTLVDFMRLYDPNSKGKTLFFTTTTWRNEPFGPPPPAN